MPKPLRVFQSPDGLPWGVEVTLTGSTNALVLFRHPDRAASRKDRYCWFVAGAPEGRSVTSSLPAAQVLEALTDADLARLYRRSLPISASGNPMAANPQNRSA